MKEYIFNFHGIGAPPPEVDPSELRYWMSIDSFCSAIDTIESLHSKTGVPISVTFDDGNKSDAHIALPELVRRGLKASFFVCAGRIGQPNYLGQKEILQLQQAGMIVGSHGMRHVNWRMTNDAELDSEVGESKSILERICGSGVNDAGIPFGSYDRRVLSKLKSAGYTQVYTSDGGHAKPHDWIKSRTTLDKFWERDDVISNVVTQNSTVQIKRKISRFFKKFR